MGKQKYQQDIERLLSKSPVVSFASLERLVRSRKKVRQYVKQLVRKGKLKRLAKEG